MSQGGPPGGESCGTGFFDNRNACEAGIYHSKKKDGVYGENNFRRTEKTIYQFICDEFYVPMKAKEMAVVLSVPKSQRSELQRE